MFSCFYCLSNWKKRCMIFAVFLKGNFTKIICIFGPQSKILNFFISKNSKLSLNKSRIASSDKTTSFIRLFLKGNSTQTFFFFWTQKQKKISDNKTCFMFCLMYWSWREKQCNPSKWMQFNVLTHLTVNATLNAYLSWLFLFKMWSYLKAVNVIHFQYWVIFFVILWFFFFFKC